MYPVSASSTSGKTRKPEPAHKPRYVVLGPDKGVMHMAIGGAVKRGVGSQGKAGPQAVVAADHGDGCRPVRALTPTSFPQRAASGWPASLA
jgi:hypothetical protein